MYLISNFISSCSNNLNRCDIRPTRLLFPIQRTCEKRLLIFWSGGFALFVCFSLFRDVLLLQSPLSSKQTVCLCSANSSTRGKIYGHFASEHIYCVECGDRRNYTLSTETHLAWRFSLVTINATLGNAVAKQTFSSLHITEYKNTRDNNHNSIRQCQQWLPCRLNKNNSQTLKLHFITYLRYRLFYCTE